MTQAWSDDEELLSLAIDTNLLLLLVVGLASKRLIKDRKHKRLQQYGADDYDKLAEVAGKVRDIIVTPSVLTEVCNLAPHGIHEPLRSRILLIIAQLVRGFNENLIRCLNEKYTPSRDVVTDDNFLKLGLTDCAWLLTMDTKTILLTDDKDLYNAAMARGLKAARFSI